MATDSSLSFGQAITQWILYVITFIVAGGVAAGAASWVFQMISGEPQSLPMYVLIFAASGLIAYRLIRQVMA